MFSFNLIFIPDDLQDDYTERLPPIHQLLSEFHVNSDIAFFLARCCSYYWYCSCYSHSLRPMFNYLISTKYDELRRGDKLWKQRTAAERQVGGYTVYVPPGSQLSFQTMGMFF